MKLVRAKEDGGVYVVFKNHHMLADGISMLTVFSKAQDGGEAAHESNGIKVAPRQHYSRWEMLADTGRVVNILSDFTKNSVHRESAIRKSAPP